MSPRKSRAARAALNAEPTEPITPQPDDNDEQLPIFTQLKRYTEAEWDRLLVYLYRLEPRVKNSDGPAYIEKFGRAIDEDDIKNAHGGGKYQVWLKDTATDETIRKVNVVISGPPVLQSNQILQPNAAAVAANPANPAAPAANAPAQQDALTAVVGMLERTLSSVKHEQPTAEQANKILIDTMQRAHTMSLELVTKSQGAAANSSNTVMDKLLTVALDRMTKEKDPMAEMKNTIELMKLLKPDAPAPAASSGNALDAFKLVKDSLGLDVKEMLELKNENSDGNSPWLGPLTAAIPNVVDAVPRVFQELNQGKRIELEIQRTHLQREQLQLRAMEIQRGLPPSAQVPAAPHPGPSQADAGAPSIPPLITPPATHGAGAASAAPATPAADSSEAELNQLAELVVRCFNSDRTGEETADMVDMVYPAAVAQLEPFIVDVGTVDAIVRSHPILSRICSGPRYMEFLEQFVDYFIGEDDGDEVLDAGAKVTA